jgi:hypothetical protein
MRIGDRVKCRFLGSEERGVIIRVYSGGSVSIQLDSGCRTLKSAESCEPA